VVNFKLSSLPQYFIPEPGSITNYKDYILTLPQTDRCVCLCMYAWQPQACIVPQQRSLLMGDVGYTLQLCMSHEGGVAQSA
jgi:hypothetical protein